MATGCHSSAPYRTLETLATNFPSNFVSQKLGLAEALPPLTVQAVAIERSVVSDLVASGGTRAYCKKFDPVIVFILIFYLQCIFLIPVVMLV